MNKKESKKAGKEELKETQDQQQQQQQAQDQDNQPKVQQIQTEGFGRFEYRNGIIYEGHWKLVNGQKVKDGTGILIINGSSTSEIGNEEYRGEWKNDEMEGFGVYKYTSGAIYSGQWIKGKQNGKGTYEFPDGTIYEGEWKDHRMHGEGYYIDKLGNKWEGEFVEGVFQSKMQKELKMEKMIKKKEQQIIDSCKVFFKNFQESFAKSDKKTFKENLLPYFATTDDVKLYIKDVAVKYEDRTPDKWNDAITYVSNYTSLNVIKHNSQAKIIDPSNILSPQFQGQGQIVELKKEQPERTVKLVVCNLQDNNWVIVFFHDSAEPEPKKK